jgi:hypothetical protein
MSTQYTREYFIAKFEAIPEEKWTTDTYRDAAGRCCALGHCKEGIEQRELSNRLLMVGASAIQVNDKKNRRYQQPTPKQRILAALRDLPETK